MYPVQGVHLETLVCSSLEVSGVPLDLSLILFDIGLVRDI
jgi:hypothetical protein